MAESIFGATWRPIHVAVAWVVTRDRAFVERTNRPGKSLRFIAVALAMEKVNGKPTEHYFKGITDAWSALREEMAAGNVRASGTPFWRVADLQGHAVETNEMAREIPAVEIASLRLQDDGNDKDCLVPENWRVAHGSNWNNLPRVSHRSGFPGRRASCIRCRSSARETKPGAPPGGIQLGRRQTQLSDYLSQHGPMQTLDELMQKCADFACDLHPKKRTPSDKTIREAIKTHALGAAAGFSPGKSPGK